jgi:hypothetical protein
VIFRGKNVRKIGPWSPCTWWRRKFLKQLRQKTKWGLLGRES